MKIHEYQAAAIFEKAHIPVPPGEVVETLDAAVAAAEKIGYPVVLKSQVLVGGRGKAGGIKMVRCAEDLAVNFTSLKALTIKGYPVEKVFVVKALFIVKEIYVAVTVDAVREDVVLIASAEGGVEIEQMAKDNPQAIQKFYLEGQRILDEKRWPVFVETLFEDPEHRQQATTLCQRLVEVFFAHDCSLAEINPLVIDDQGRLMAADAKVNFDDNALDRHEEMVALRDRTYEDADELEATENDLSFVKLEGNVGCIVNGAGLAMGTMDIIKLLGGQPANFLDVGGSSNPTKVLNALKIILRNQEVKAILINIFGGITRCDDIAQGLLTARGQMDLSVPLVVRLTGTNEEEAKALLAAHDIDTYATMREAVIRVVALANKDEA